MSWTVFNQLRSGGSSIGLTFPLRSDSPSYITLAGHSRQTLAVTFTPEGPQPALGKITVGAWGASLEALADGLQIIPGDASISQEPQAEGYKLRPSNDGHTEVILLRNGDRIRCSNCASDLVCQWQPSEILVNSSAVADPSESIEQLKAVVEKTPEEMPGDSSETENEDLDEGVESIKATQPKPQPSRDTPVPSISRSVVVQETPTTNRVNGWTVMAASSQTPKNNADHISHAPSQEDAPFSTAKSSVPESRATEATVQTPEDIPQTASPSMQKASLSVVIKASRTGKNDKLVTEHTAITGDLPTAKPLAKRASPVEKERPNKRTKKDEDSAVEDSRPGDTSIDASRRLGTVPKGKARLSDSAPQDHTITSSAASTSTYEGSKPHVAFSNSAITDKSAAMKFLKKRGVVLESVKDECNFLCVRDGALSKTMKLLKSIAHGIPIVTDRWLIDSAKAGDFLPKDAYIPAVQDQEKEWGFSLANIYEKPQSSLFDGYTMVFTPALRGTYKDFKEMEEVCKAVGATKVISRKKGSNDGNEKTIVLAKEEGDEDASKQIQDGRTCYTKDLLINSILRGTVNLESDEFKIRLAGSTPITDPAPAPPSAKGKKGRPRKSLS